MDFDSLINLLTSANETLGNLIQLWGVLVVIFHAVTYVLKRGRGTAPAPKEKASPSPRSRRPWLAGVAATGSLVTVLSVVITLLYLNGNSSKISLGDIIGAIILMILAVLLGLAIGFIATLWGLVSALRLHRWTWALVMLIVGIAPLLYLLLDDPLSLKSVGVLYAPVFLLALLPGLPAFIYAMWGPTRVPLAQATMVGRGG